MKANAPPAAGEPQTRGRARPAGAMLAPWSPRLSRPHSLKSAREKSAASRSLPHVFTLHLLPKPRGAQNLPASEGFLSQGCPCSEVQANHLGGNSYSASSAPKLLGEGTCNNSHSGQKRLKVLISPQETVQLRLTYNQFDVKPETYFNTFAVFRRKIFYPKSSSVL